MSKVHEYVLVLPDGKYELTKSNGPICFQQSRQEVGGHFGSFDPQVGHGFTAQINENGSGLKLAPIITHHYAVQEFKQGFETMGSGKSGKVILDWSTL